MDNKFNNIDGEHKFLSHQNPINFMLSLLIVFHHSFLSNVDYNGSFKIENYGIEIFIQRLMYNISECAVPVFFFISSYLFYRNFDGSLKCYKYKISRRFWSLFVPYIIFMTLGYVKYIVVNNLSFSFYGYIEELVVAKTMPLWFIRELIIISILSPILFYIKSNRTFISIITIISFCLVICGVVGYRCFIYWLPIYLFGAFLSKNHINYFFYCLSESMSKRIVCGSLFIVYVFASWFLPNISSGKMDYLGNTIFIFYRFITPIMWLIIAYYIVYLDIKDVVWMKFSFFVYCIHFPIISFLKIITNKLLYFPEIFLYVFIVVATYILSVIIAMVIKKVSPNVWFIINGKRK